MYLVSSVFTSRPTYFLESIEAMCFPLWYHSHRQHQPEADVSHLASVPPGFLVPSQQPNLKNS
jgi:hypothetical protein